MIVSTDDFLGNWGDKKESPDDVLPGVLGGLKNAVPPILVGAGGTLPWDRSDNREP